MAAPPGLAHDETTRLFDAARGGAPDAVDALYRRCAGKLLPWIRLRMGRTLRAEMESRDILQSVMVKAVQKLPTLQQGEALMAWLAKIADREILDRVDYVQRDRRDAARKVPLDAAADVPAPLRRALSQVILNEQAERLERALEALPSDQREVIVLRKLEELSFAEIGQRIAKSEDAARMAFSRAMAALARRLQSER